MAPLGIRTAAALFCGRAAAVPLGVVGPSLDRPYDVVLHGAEVTVAVKGANSRGDHVTGTVTLEVAS